MRLTTKAISEIDQLHIRLKLALVFMVTERRVSQMISDNRENGQLTTAAAMKVIREETGLGDSEILEESNSRTAA